MKFEEISLWLQQIVNFKLFVIRETPVTISSLILFVLVLLMFEVLGRILIKRLLGRVLSRTSLEEGLRYALLRMGHYLLLMAGLIIGLQVVGFDVTGLFVVFGFLSVGIGFGLQNITSNWISGVILLFERPIKVGDRVTVGDLEGDVQEINMRSTTVRSLNNISIIVPNSDFISSTVINWSHSDHKIRLEVEVGVSYTSDLDTVLRCLKEIAEENEEVLDDPKHDIIFKGFGDSAWNLMLRVWINDPKRHPRVRSDINCEIVRKFRANGVEIPYPQRDLHVRSPLPVPLTSEPLPPA
ncbi:MAG: mechanosensitive ion channel [Ignavibacteria bacterium]|nr:mechanosensitive ion channel [Ignavibacteria bacterium]